MPDELPHDRQEVLRQVSDDVLLMMSFISETALQFIVERSPDLPADSSHTVNITIEPLRDGLYLVSWQEASGNTVVHVEDLKEHRVHAFLSMKDARFIRQDAPLVEVDTIVF